MNPVEKIDTLVNVCHLIHRKGLVSGSGGNVSIRAENGILITASGIALEATTPENLVFVSGDGSYNGHLCPSKETSLHLKCYATRPEVLAVVHVHSVYSVALSCMSALCGNNVVPAYTPGFGIRVGHLPVIPYYCPGSPQLADAVSTVIAKRDSVLMQNHGLVTVGDTLESALNLVEEIEENAKIHFILRGAGVALSPEQIETLQSQY